MDDGWSRCMVLPECRLCTRIKHECEFSYEIKVRFKGATNRTGVVSGKTP